MSRSHVRMSDAGLTPRTVTRRDALRIFMGAGLCASLAPHMALAATTQEKLDAAQLSYEEAQAELERIGEEYSEIASQVSETQVEISGVTTQVNGTQAVIDDTQDAAPAEEEDGDKGMIAMAAAIAVGIAAAAGAIAMGIAVAKTNESIARQPEAKADIRSSMMLGLVFIETAIIYALIVAILLIFVL